MTEADVDRLRKQVPDDPVRRRKGQLACEGCGIAVEGATEVRTAPVGGAPLGGRVQALRKEAPDPLSVHYTRCEVCCAVHERAVAYVAAHKGLAGRWGDLGATERVEGVLYALAVIDQEPPDDLAFVLGRMMLPAMRVRFFQPDTATVGVCNPRPFAHVGMSLRAELRSSYAASLRDRLAKSAPPVVLPCPTVACMLCGITTVTRSAAEVSSQGGREAAAAIAWQRQTTTPKGLGTGGPGLVVGHLCPTCARVIDDVGAFGQTAMGWAVQNYLERSEDPRAARFRQAMGQDFPPRLRAWRGMPAPRIPNAEPWGHLRKVLDRL